MPAAIKKGLMVLLILLCNVSFALAGNEISGQDGDQIRQHLRDDSCVIDTADDNGTAPVLLTQRSRGQNKGQGRGDQDRRRDGSCLDNMDPVNPTVFG
jgi:hypothetical protein